MTSTQEGDFAFYDLKMSQKPSKSIGGDEKTVTKQTSSSSDPLVIKSSKGKQIIAMKIETLVEQEKKTGRNKFARI